MAKSRIETTRIGIEEESGVCIIMGIRPTHHKLNDSATMKITPYDTVKASEPGVKQFFISFNSPLFLIHLAVNINNVKNTDKSIDSHHTKPLPLPSPYKLLRTS